MSGMSLGGNDGVVGIEKLLVFESQLSQDLGYEKLGQLTLMTKR